MQLTAFGHRVQVHVTREVLIEGELAKVNVCID